MQEIFINYLLDKIFEYGRIWLGSTLVFGGIMGFFGYLFRFNFVKWVGSILSIPLGLWVLGDLERVTGFVQKFWSTL